MFVCFAICSRARFTVAPPMKMPSTPTSATGVAPSVTTQATTRSGSRTPLPGTAFHPPGMDAPTSGVTSTDPKPACRSPGACNKRTQNSAAIIGPPVHAHRCARDPTLFRGGKSSNRILDLLAEAVVLWSISNRGCPHDQSRPGGYGIHGLDPLAGLPRLPRDRGDRSLHAGASSSGGRLARDPRELWSPRGNGGCEPAGQVPADRGDAGGPYGRPGGSLPSSALARGGLDSCPESRQACVLREADGPDDRGRRADD